MIEWPTPSTLSKSTTTQNLHNMIAHLLQPKLLTSSDRHTRQKKTSILTPGFYPMQQFIKQSLFVNSRPIFD